MGNIQYIQCRTTDYFVHVANRERHVSDIR